MTESPRSHSRARLWWWGGGIAVGVLLAATFPWWRPAALQAWSQITAASTATPVAAGEAEDEHDHGGKEQELPLSEQARKNLNLQLGPIALQEYWRTIMVPAILGERPGHSERRITTSINGIVTKVHAEPGQMVRPGDPLFDVQPTGELLSNAQASLLKTLQDLELVELEMKRIQPLVDSGTIPGTRLIEKKYEQQRFQSLKEVQTQELLVRGLSEEQVEQIVNSKVLLRQFTVRVPGLKPGTTEPAARSRKPMRVQPVAFHDELEDLRQDITYSIEKIDVFPGKLITPDDELCDLEAHHELQIIGMAFQRESDLVIRALEQSWPVTALIDTSREEPTLKEKLQIRYTDNLIDVEQGTFRFYLPIQNEVARDVMGANGRNYRSWRFKPGQRARLLLPVEHWQERIVLPVDAVVREGVDAYVFRSNGSLLERVPVTVDYEDSRSCVLANDGSLFPGDRVALNQAYQLNLAMKKLQGAGVDPHAGHNHAH